MRGQFNSQIIVNDKVTYDYSAPNKIVSGSRRLVTEVLATRFLSFGSGVDIGLSKFVLYDISNEPTCITQSIAGMFESYDLFDPIYETEINSTNFPCLTNDSIVVDTITHNATEEPLEDESLIYASIDDNQINLVVKIGKGFVGLNNRKFSLAALLGKSTNLDRPSMVYAIEQFPLMVKTSVAFFKFNWTCFI